MHWSCVEKLIFVSAETPAAVCRGSQSHGWAIIREKAQRCIGLRAILRAVCSHNEGRGKVWVQSIGKEAKV